MTDFEKKNNETKNDKFKRLATDRVNRVIELLSRIENLSNTNNYDYDDQDVTKITNALDRAIRDLKASFRNNSKKDKFKL
tara:strand:+ start:618 stop:857 length:240 start_codon:yes stop_codon:yes gene_type:complete